MSGSATDRNERHLNRRFEISQLCEKKYGRLWQIPTKRTRYQVIKNSSMFNFLIMHLSCLNIFTFDRFRWSQAHKTPFSSRVVHSNRIASTSKPRNDWVRLEVKQNLKLSVKCIDHLDVPDKSQTCGDLRWCVALINRKLALRLYLAHRR